ncbi:MAG: hypothetical protein OEY23_06910 [Acidimicrobiia bacterium]|nr:hypothetical protein [Acidimicrobiia bacterium]
MRKLTALTALTVAGGLGAATLAWSALPAGADEAGTAAAEQLVADGNRCEAAKARFQDRMAGVAERLDGVSTEQLIAAMKAEAQERIDAKIADGTLDADKVAVVREAIETCTPSPELRELIAERGGRRGPLRGLGRMLGR